MRPALFVYVPCNKKRSWQKAGKAAGGPRLQTMLKYRILQLHEPLQGALQGGLTLHADFGGLLQLIACLGGHHNQTRAGVSACSSSVAHFLPSGTV